MKFNQDESDGVHKEPEQLLVVFWPRGEGRMGEEVKVVEIPTHHRTLHLALRAPNPWSELVEVNQVLAKA